MAEAAYSEGEWTSADGLTLRYRDYPPGRADRPPLLCIPGLTRNCRDFEPVAASVRRRMAGDLHRPARARAERLRARLRPATCRCNTSPTSPRCSTRLALERVVAIGTSLGGIVTMLLALTAPRADRRRGAQRHRARWSRPPGWRGSATTSARGRSYPDLDARRARAPGAGRVWPIPTSRSADWLRLAKRLLVRRPRRAHRVRLRHEDRRAVQPPRYRRAVRHVAGRSARSAGRPVLAMRGALSDILSAATLERMRSELEEPARRSPFRASATRRHSRSRRRSAAIAALLAKVA